MLSEVEPAQCDTWTSGGGRHQDRLRNRVTEKQEETQRARGCEKTSQGETLRVETIQLKTVTVWNEV